MSPMLMKLLARCQAPAGDDGADAGGAATLDEEVRPEKEDRGDEVSPELTAENLQAVVGNETEADPEQGADPANASGDEAERGASAAGIPKSRFNEVNEQRKQALAELAAAQEELDRLRAEKAPPEPKEPPVVFDEDAHEQAYMEALLDGDTKKAAGIRREINAHLREQAAVTARQEAERARQADVEKAQATALQGEVALTLEAYPYLNTPDGAEAVELIVAARDAKIARGVAPHEALRAAVKVIAPKFAPADADDPPARVSQDKDKKGDLRAAAAVARGAAASVAQPAQLNGGVGERAESGRMNVERMTDEQFAALPEAEKRKLRGD